MPAPPIAQTAAAQPMLPTVGPGPESIRRRQQLAEAMLQQATQVEPIYSPLQGVAKLGSAALAGWQDYTAGRESDKSQAAAMNQLIDAYAGFGAAGPGSRPSDAAGGAAPAAGGWTASGAPAGSYGGEDLPEWQRTLMMRESSGRPGIVNSDGYSGLYQFGEAAAHDAGFYSGDGNLKDNEWGGTFTGPNGTLSYDKWLHSPEAQNYGFSQYDQMLEQQIQRLGLDRYVGQTVRGVPVTIAGLKMGMHLGGVGGVQGWLKGSGNASDSNGTTVGSYVAMGSQFPDAVPAMLEDGPLVGDPIGSSADLVASADAKAKGPQYRDDVMKGRDPTEVFGLGPIGSMQWSAPSGAAPGSDLNPIMSTPSPSGQPMTADPNQRSQFAQPVQYGGTMGFAPPMPQAQPSGIPEMASRPLGADNSWAFQRDPQLAQTGDVQTAQTLPYSGAPMPLSGLPVTQAGAGPAPVQAQPQGPQMAQVGPSPNAMPDTFAMMAQQGMEQPIAPKPQPAPAALDQVADAGGKLGVGAAPPPPAPIASRAPGGQPAPGMSRDDHLRALIAAMSNPWLSDTGRQIGGILLGRAFGPDPSEAPDMRDRIDGNDQVVEQYDPRTGQWIEVSRGPRWDPNGHTGQTDKERNLRLAGIDPQSPEGRAYLLSTGGTTINMGDGGNAGDKEFYGALGKQDAERYGAISTAGANAQTTLGNLNALEAALQDTPQGALQPVMNELAGIATGLGIDVGDTSLANAQAVEAIVAQIAPKLRVPGSGTTSDRDLSLFLQSLPSISKLPDANRIIISTLRAFASRSIEEAGIVNQIRSGRLTRSGAEKMLAALGPVITPEMAQGWQGAGAAQPTTGLAVGTPAYGGQPQPGGGGYDPLSSMQPGPVPVQTEAEFLRLPSGTEARFPNGKTGTRP